MASSQKVKSGTEQQVELWIELKEQVDLVYKQLNQYRGACRSVDRLNRAVRRTGGQLDPGRMLAEFVKFERDYRVSRKRLRKLDRQLLAVNLYDKLYDLYGSLVKGESIGTGGDLIDSSAIVVGCNGIDDSSVDDFDCVSIDPDTHIDVEMDLMEDACLEPRQSETLNHSLNKSSPDLPQSSSILVADVSGSTREIRQQTRRMSTVGSVLRKMNKDEANIDLSAIVVGCNGPVGIEDTSVDGLAGTERSFQCPQCDKSFKTSSALSHHKWTHSSEPRFKCTWEGCDFGTHESSKLNVHQTVHSDERPFQCSQCDKSFKYSAGLTSHKKIHKGESRFKCSWEGCDFGTHRNDFLKNHKTVHTGDRAFQCPQCDKSFKTSSNLSIHKRIHESEPRFKCSWEGCDFGTHRNDFLKVHMYVHTGETPFRCPQCDKSFKTSTVLWNHKRSHDSKKRFKCSWEGCDFGTYRNDFLKGHEFVHTGKRPFHCPQCDKSFYSPSCLSRHKRTHESEPRFKCSWVGCGYGTNYSKSLNDHQTVHTDERSFQCPQCDKSFKTSSSLINHKRTHEGEPRFKCSWEGCDYGSHHRVLLTKHQNRHMANRI